MRYIGELIGEARSDTREDVDIPTGASYVGITTADYLRFANWAQERLQGLIIKQHARAFLSYQEIDIVGGKSTYQIDDNVYQNTRIFKVDYSPSGQVNDYTRLRPKNPYEATGRSGQPQTYLRFNGDVVLDPVPSNTQGKIRVYYQRALDKLVLRMGVTSTVTIAGSNLTAVILDSNGLDPTYVTLAASRSDFSLVDKDGRLRALNVPYTSYNSITRAFSFTPFQLGPGNLPAVGNYVALGKYSVTHSSLPTNCERYLTEYMSQRIFKRKSSDDAFVIDGELRSIEEEIVNNYKIPDDDIHDFPTGEYENVAMMSNIYEY